MKTRRIVLAIAAVALVAAALVGITVAQLNSQTPTATVAPNGQVLPPCITGNNGVVPPNCTNAVTGEPYCFNNGTFTGYCNGYGYCQSGANCGYGVQNQFQSGWGMMGRSGYGRGCR